MDFGGVHRDVWDYCGDDDDDAVDEIAGVEHDGETVGNEPIVRQYRENNLNNDANDNSITRQRPNNLANDVEREDADEEVGVGEEEGLADSFRRLGCLLQITIENL